jgi:hypothetical protein
MSVEKARNFELNFIIFMLQHDSAKFYHYCMVSKNVSCSFIYWTEGVVSHKITLPTCVCSHLVVFFNKIWNSKCSRLGIIYVMQYNLKVQHNAEF